MPKMYQSGYGIGIGHVEHEDDVGPSRSLGFSRKLRKKPWRLQGVLSNHLGNEFKKACTLMVVAPEPELLLFVHHHRNPPPHLPDHSVPRAAHCRCLALWLGFWPASWHCFCLFSHAVRCP
jgi:hypothetical protein